MVRLGELGEFGYSACILSVAGFVYIIPDVFLNNYAVCLQMLSLWT